MKKFIIVNATRTNEILCRPTETRVNVDAIEYWYPHGTEYTHLRLRGGEGLLARESIESIDAKLSGAMESTGSYQALEDLKRATERATVSAGEQPYQPMNLVRRVKGLENSAAFSSRDCKFLPVTEAQLEKNTLYALVLVGGPSGEVQPMVLNVRPGYPLPLELQEALIADIRKGGSGYLLPGESILSIDLVEWTGAGESESYPGVMGNTFVDPDNGKTWFYALTEEETPHQSRRVTFDRNGFCQVDLWSMSPEEQYLVVEFSSPSADQYRRQAIYAWRKELNASEYALADCFNKPDYHIPGEHVSSVNRVWGKLVEPGERTTYLTLVGKEGRGLYVDRG